MSEHAKQFIARMRELSRIECKMLDGMDKMPMDCRRHLAASIADTELNRIMANMRGKK